MINNFEYPGQFILTNHPLKHPANYRTYKHLDWTLSTDLNVVSLYDSEKQFIGWAMGWIITKAGNLLKESYGFNSPLRNNEVDFSVLENEFYDWGGRFCVILLNQNSRFYLDCSGFLAAVYEVSKGPNKTEITVASTTTLIAWAKERELIKANLEPNQFFPIFLTNDPKCRRLVLNHYLNLNTGNQSRHRFFETPKKVEKREIPDLIREISFYIKNTINTVVRESELEPYLGITAGQDSRMLLACEGENREKINHFTFLFPYIKKAEKSAENDEIISSMIANKFKLRHQFITVEKKQQEECENYLERIGYCLYHGKAENYYYSFMTKLKENQPFFIGYGGEAGRSYWTGRFSHLGEKVRVADILKILKWEKFSGAYEEVERWMSSFESDSLDSFVAILYNEMRTSCWASPQLYGYWNIYTIAPLSHQRIYDAMIKLPIDYRQTHQLSKDIIEFCEPSLMKIPLYKIETPKNKLMRIAKKMFSVLK